MYTCTVGIDAETHNESDTNPIKICSPDCKQVQSSGPEEKEVTYPSPFNKQSLTHLAAGRHSDDALQLMRGILPAFPVEELEGTEVAMGEELLKHHCVQMASPMDLNKSLPAFPLQVRGQDGKKWARP